MMFIKLSFLSLMSVSLGRTVSCLPVYNEIPWEEVFRLAEQHHVLPMVVDAAYKVYGNDILKDHLAPYKKRAQKLTYLQTVKTERFLSVYRFLSGKGLNPLIMKGLICRKLYPKPDFRFSVDEDLLIPPDEAIRYHEALLAFGMKANVPEQSIAAAQEVSYTSADRVLSLEVHRLPFSEDSGAYGEYNEYFENVFERVVSVSVSGVDIQTMAPTDHLFYLICHVLKHFLHGGCGIRQVCDIGLFAQAYGEQIDWSRLLEQIASIRATDFTAALFAIADKSLGIGIADLPKDLCSREIDPEALLDDILESGVHGSSTMSRKHSATITLRAAENAGSGKNAKKSSKTRTLFPAASDLEKWYPYLKKHRWLLPVAWVQRILRYLRAGNASNTPGEALRIGRERVSLMEQYGLLSEEPVKQVDTKEYLLAMCELIDQGNEVSIPVVGSSMTPFLGDGRDQVYVKAPERPIRKGDIVLYRRRNGDFVLHRVCQVHGKGDDATYDMIGDSQDIIERGIQRAQIIAMATRARRKGKIIEPGSFNWRFFQNVWIRIIPLRRFLRRIYRVIKI